MTRKRVGGTLSTGAMAALAALRRTETGEVRQPRHFDRPVDRIDFVREARRLTSEGATIDDIAAALDVPTAVIKQLMGGTGRRPRAARSPSPSRKTQREQR